MLLQIVQISSKFNYSLENTTLKPPTPPYSLHILEIHFRPLLTPYRLSLIEILFFVKLTYDVTLTCIYSKMVTPSFFGESSLLLF